MSAFVMFVLTTFTLSLLFYIVKHSSIILLYLYTIIVFILYIFTF